MKDAASASQNADAVATTISFFFQSACLRVSRYIMDRTIGYALLTHVESPRVMRTILTGTKMPE